MFFGSFLPAMPCQYSLVQQVDCGTEDAWLAHLQGCPGLASLGANVYEAFCSCETGETGEAGLGQKMLDTVRAWI